MHKSKCDGKNKSHTPYKECRKEDDDPIDIFLDMDLPYECRLEAEDKLKDAGFKFSTSLRDQNSPDKNSDNTDNDVDDYDDAATDEGLEPDFVMTGE